MARDKKRRKEEEEGGGGDIFSLVSRVLALSCFLATREDLSDLVDPFH